MARIIQSFAEISDQYDAAFVDLWGCMHNGVAAFPAAVAAMQGFRARGGRVIFVTNAPRPRGPIEEQVRLLGIPDDAWDAIATSGDSARVAMFRGVVGQKVWFIGAPGDQSFFVPPKVVADPVEITCVPLSEAEGIVCTGPFNPLEDPVVYRPQFLAAKTRGLKLLCANPDIIVDRGESREWCAGALAQLYTEMGGESLYFGKPHPPIYDLARRRLAETGLSTGEARIIAIGDGIATDVQGAMGEDLDCLFITGGLAAAETLTADQPDPAALDSFLAAAQMGVTYAIGFLR
jgi:ribonucleotide monophosphatase NagD (HAD superfamily)